MIYEFRTYRMKVGSLPEVLKRFGEAYEHRKKYSPLMAFWYTEIGPLNEITHVWPYQDLAERTRVRADAAKDPNWPPKIAEFIETMQSNIVFPYEFVPVLPAGKHGPIYEFRYYTYKAGSLPKIQERWKAKLPERTPLSKPAFAGYTELGALNLHIHIWPYPTLNDRGAIRKKAVDTGAWPPPGGGEIWTEMNNKVLLPADFSPMQ